MSATHYASTKKNAEPASPAPKPEVRHAVRDLLLQSASFSKLPPETQKQIAHDMAQVADYLVSPEGIPGNKLPTAQALTAPKAFAAGDPSQSTYERDVRQVNRVGEGFKAVAA